MMVGIDVTKLAFDNDFDFSEALFREESVMVPTLCFFVRNLVRPCRSHDRRRQVLPGRCFNFPNFFRIVPCAPAALLAEACQRIAAFAARHRTAVVRLDS